MSNFNTTTVNTNYQNQRSPDGRTRISSQLSIGAYKQIIDNDAGNFDSYTNNAATITYEAGSLIGGTELKVNTAADIAIRQSYQWHNYFPGKPQKIELTFSRFDVESSITKRVGYFSSTPSAPYDSGLDGFFFQSDDTNGITVNIYREGTLIYRLAQANWENQDKVGSLTFDNFTFTTIDFLYLGGAVANFWVEVPSGELVKIASYTHIDVDPSTFVKSPNQPVRYEIRSAGGVGTLNQICGDVATEGQLSNTGSLRTYNTNSTGLSGMVTGTRYALLGVRKLDPRIIFDFKVLSVLSTSNDDFLVEVIFGGATVGAAPWAAIPFTHAEGFKGANIGGAIAQKVHSGGVTIISYYLSQQASFTPNINTARKLGTYLDGTQEECYICVTPLSSNGAAYSSIAWLEF